MKTIVFHDQSKHIDICFHFIWECIEHEQIIFDYLNSKEQQAHISIKALAHVKHGELQNMIDIYETKFSTF